MNIACISDTHGIFLPEIPPSADLVIHAGDISRDRGSREWLEKEFSQWAEDLKIPVYATWGNHDFIGERRWTDIGLPYNVKIVVDRQVDIEGLKVWFSPWSNLFGDWAFMETESELKARYSVIPEDTDILVSHGPPKGLGDRIFWDRREQHVGSQSLLDRFLELPKAKVIVCGHIHEAMGVYPLPHLLGEDGIRSVINCSQVNAQYQPVYNAVRMLEL